MVHIGNAPKQSLEVQVFRLLRRHPSGVTREFIDARFRRETRADLDTALECLRATGAATCTNGLWWAR